MNPDIASRVKSIQELLGLSQQELADAIDLDPTKLSKSLNGARRFSSLELARIASLGRRSVDWLISGDEGRVFALAARAQVQTRDLGQTGREAISRLAERYDGLDALGLAPRGPELPERARLGGYVMQANQLASAARALIKAPSVDTDMSTFVALVEERLGVSVTIVDLPPGYDGLSYQDGYFRAILLARTNKAVRQRYTLAHEIGHVLWGDARETPIEEGAGLSRGYDDPNQEKRANVFAAAFAMPEHEIRATLGDRDANETFDELVWRFGVSPNSMAWRLFNLGVISDADRASLGAVSSRRSAERFAKADEHALRCQQSNVSRPPMPLVSAYIDAYNRGLATLTPLSELLGWSLDEAQSFFGEGDDLDLFDQNPEAES